MSEALKRMRERLDAQVGKYLRFVAEDWRANVSRRFGHGSITSRSGRLAGSLSYRLGGSTIRDYELRMVSAGVPYAKTQEFGGVIRAKKKFLTIPLASMKTAAGVARAGFREWLTQAKATGKVRWIPKGNGFLIAWGPKDGKSSDLYWKLQPFVTLPGPITTGSPSRLGFFDTWKAGEAKRASLFRRFCGADALFSRGGG